MSYINKASSEASDDDASLDAFCVQSVPNGASRSREPGQARAQELVKPMELPEDGKQKERRGEGRWRRLLNANTSNGRSRRD